MNDSDTYLNPFFSAHSRPSFSVTTLFFSSVLFPQTAMNKPLAPYFEDSANQASNASKEDLELTSNTRTACMH